MNGLIIFSKITVEFTEKYFLIIILLLTLSDLELVVGSMVQWFNSSVDQLFNGSADQLFNGSVFFFYLLFAREQSPFANPQPHNSAFIGMR